MVAEYPAVPPSNPFSRFFRRVTCAYRGHWLVPIEVSIIETSPGLDVTHTTLRCVRCNVTRIATHRAPGSPRGSRRNLP